MGQSTKFSRETKRVGETQRESEQGSAWQLSLPVVTFGTGRFARLALQLVPLPHQSNAKVQPHALPKWHASVQSSLVERRTREQMSEVGDACGGGGRS